MVYDWIKEYLVGLVKLKKFWVFERHDYVKSSKLYTVLEFSWRKSSISFSAYLTQSCTLRFLQTISWGLFEATSIEFFNGPQAGSLLVSAICKLDFF